MTYYRVIEKVMEQNFRNMAEDGWDNFQDSSEESIPLISLYHHNKGRPILKEQYSLEPDMATGWVPKLPSCPLPLTYQNSQIQEILLKLEFDSRFQILYRGPRPINSVQLHQKYSYPWKYREKYDVKIDAISQAVQSVGKNPSSLSYLPSSSTANCEFSFSSDFEGGNCDLVVRVKPLQFDCFMRSDTNTRGHTNWYYFRVCNGRQLGTVQFNVCNIAKQKNLYNKGMTPYTARSQPGSLENELQWKQNDCYDVQFVQRLCRYGTNRVQHQLQFKYEFNQEQMQVFFAYSIPYSYSRLHQFMASLEDQPLAKVSSLCDSFGGLTLPLLTISKEDPSPKMNAVIVARIHPGETNSSHMLEGFVQSLLDNSPNAQKLLATTNFHIVPMINPDGVVAGNYRTSFSGRDLNRSFRQIGSHYYPQINGLVALIKRLRSQRKKVEFFMDFHSHSCKKDLFCYGPQHPEGTLHYFRSRILVKIMQKQSAMFSPSKCLYQISEHKKTTGRSYMLKMQKIPMSFTFEVSNGIFSINKETEAPFDRKSLLYAGRVVSSGLADYCWHYHKDIAQQPRLKVFKFKDERLSFSVNTRHYFQFRKKLKAATVVQGSRFDSSLPDIKTMINEIIEDKQPIEVNEQGSDSEDSEHDITEDELNGIFATRTKFGLTASESKLTLALASKSVEKVSLRKIKSKKDILRAAVATVQVVRQKIDPPLLRKSRSRIYYQETHPRAAKKLVQSPLEARRALKQKKFPIFF